MSKPWPYSKEWWDGITFPLSEENEWSIDMYERWETACDMGGLKCIYGTCPGQTFDPPCGACCGCTGGCVTDYLAGKYD